MFLFWLFFTKISQYICGETTPVPPEESGAP